ncbi:hypothetical protein [Marinactinospora rubrisoli]|uniref:Uncharacterized protein n=1 Tax=Marinactinospora rubrisoli TaxID=2715399 RepID=A0ABW2KKQ5_9ACTN
MTLINTVRTDPANATGLEYRLYTNPHPLRVSPQGAEEGDDPAIDPARGQLTIVASRAARYPLLLRKLSVKVPTGTNSPDLALSLDRVESTISLGWGSRVNNGWIEFTPTDPHVEIGADEGVTVIIGNIPINHEVGAVELVVEEESAEKPPSGDPDWDTRRASLFTGKFPLDFYLDQFMADRQEINNGGDVKLTWKRSEGANTTLLYGGNDPIDVRDREQYEVKNVKQTTTFYLIGSVGNVEIIRSVMVTVLNPDLVVNKLTVNDSLEAKGDVTVAAGKALAVNTIRSTGDGAITVANNLNADGSLTVTGVLQANNNITVAQGQQLAVPKIVGNGGGVTVDSALTTNAALTANENVTVASDKTLKVARVEATANNSVWVSADLAVTPGRALTTNNIRGTDDRTLTISHSNLTVIGPISLAKGRHKRVWSQNQAPTSSRPFKATAPTDGILYVQTDMFDNTSHNENQGYKATFWVTVGGQTYRCQEAMLRQTGADGRRNSLAIQVSKGESIQAYLTVDGSTWYSRVGTVLIWFPFGTNTDLSVTQAAGEVTEEHEEAVAEPVQVPEQAASGEVRETT